MVLGVNRPVNSKMWEKKKYDLAEAGYHPLAASRRAKVSRSRIFSTSYGEWYYDCLIILMELHGKPYMLICEVVLVQFKQR
ncbi:hypothetical protein CW304_09435 [Bacillus sp. UFRGS-B20]|nr:hypothetical protein CW304_09435 [Bacillus sp. UFRGS-B20]